MPITTTSRLAGGIRRCGVRHTPEPQTWPDDQFTPAELQTLQNDRDLVVQITPSETAPAQEEEEQLPAAPPTEEPVPAGVAAGEPVPITGEQPVLEDVAGPVADDEAAADTPAHVEEPVPEPSRQRRSRGP